MLCQSISLCILAAEHHCLIPDSLPAGACFLLPCLTHAASSWALILASSACWQPACSTTTPPGPGWKLDLWDSPDPVCCRIALAQFHQLGWLAGMQAGPSPGLVLMTVLLRCKTVTERLFLAQGYDQVGARPAHRIQQSCA